MRICSIALGGCLKAPPVAFGLTEDTGGHLTYVWGAASALALRDDVLDVEIVTRLIDDPSLGPDYARSEEAISNRLHITRVATSNRRYLSKEAASADRPAFIAALIHLFERRAVLPDIVHAHFADAAEVAIALRDRFGIPFILTGHSLGIDKAACGLRDGHLGDRIAAEDRAVGAADAIIASSRDEAERQLMLYPSADAGRIYRVPPGAVLDDGLPANLARARALVAPFLRQPKKPMLLAIARPVHKKNLPALVDLYARDKILRRQTNLVIVAGLRNGPDSGEAEQREVFRALLDRMDEHGLYGSLALPKRHDTRDVTALYGLARQTRGVFVNPALTEPYGLTLTEAAHHGLPVVATINGGAEDIVRELGHGMVADPGDPLAFASAIRTFVLDKDRWKSASLAGRTHSARWSWEGYAARFVTIARNIVDQRTMKRIKPSSPCAQEFLLCDIDHTLTGCRLGADALIAQLRASPRRIFGVATGRSLQEAQRIMEEWSFPTPAVWISSVGSEIYWRDDLLLRADEDYANLLRQGWRPGEIERVVADYTALRPQAAVEQRRFKRSWFAPDAAAAGRVRRRLQREGLPAKVVFSHGRFLDILPAGAGKSGAMKWVAGKLDLPLSAVFAAGDSGNDLDMLEACPNAILVANHSSELAPLIGRRGVHLARRPHAGGIADVMAQIGGLSVARAAV